MNVEDHVIQQITRFKYLTSIVQSIREIEGVVN